VGSEPDSAAQAGGQWSGLSYRRQVTLIGLNTLATVVDATVSFTWLQRQMVAASGETISIMAAEIAAKLDILLNERAGDIQILSETVGMSGGMSSSRQHILRAFHQAYSLYLWIGVTDATWERGAPFGSRFGSTSLLSSPVCRPAREKPCRGCGS